ncbi:MFS transporter [Tenggerimyces flavus]|uniref:MFS transporter n=1 Tax=Tenggerimyces flavus TaxID=1708749 RepID=A0ABV7YL23_9ACTN|nr:MFS transporter [Tenggerimyces flavus]MBM7789491.1 MFS family permease [Tenggerimyces flavus]
MLAQWRTPVRRRFPLAVYFFLVGFVPANWLVRIPDVKEQVGASAASLGLALLAGSVGGLLMTPLGGRLAMRIGTRPPIAFGAVLLSLAIVLPALATNVRWLGAALIVLTVIHSMFNVSLNSAAVEVEAAYGRSIMPTLHGTYSVGGLVGAVVGGFAAGRVSPTVHLAVIGALSLVVVALFAPRMLRADAGGTTPAAHTDPKQATPARTKHLGIIVLFGVIGLCTAWGEFAANNWANLHLRENLGASASVAAYVFAAYSCAIAAGRLLGSPVIRRIGATAVLTGGFLVAAVGMVNAAWASHIDGGGLPLAIAGYVLLGLGLANVYPIAIARAGAIGGPRGVSRVVLLAGAGILGQGPIIGFLADQFGLPWALTTVPILAVIAAGIGLSLRRYNNYAAVLPAVETERSQA